MKHLKKSPAGPAGRYILLMLLTLIMGSRTFAQDYFASLNLVNQTQNSDRAKEVIQDNEYTSTGFEQGNFYRNPLLLDGKPLDYNVFNMESKGELTVIKESAITGKPTQVLFYVYLRRDGNKVFIPDYNNSDIGQTKIEISHILRYAKPGDHLIIEPVNRADGPVKRILKLLVGGC